MTSHDPGHGGPAEDPRREHHLRDLAVEVGAVTGGERGQHEDATEQQRDREEDVGQPGQDRVDPAAEESRDNPMKPPTSMVNSVAKTPTRIEAFAP